MRIGQLSQAAGVDVETIRYYERRRLLPEPDRSRNGYRAYDSTHLERLAFIRHCRALDVPLADIGRLLDFFVRPEADCSDIDRLIDTQLMRVQARLHSMQVLEKQLLALRGQCDSRHKVCECGILHELVAATRGKACVCHPDTGTGKRRRTVPVRSKIRA